MHEAQFLTAHLSAIYALSVYLPMSRAAAVARRMGRTVRDKPSSPQSRLPRIGWRRALPKCRVRLVETEKRHGNVRLSELVILAQAAASAEPGSEIVEIGTSDGRTTLNLAVNAPVSNLIVTLDLPADHQTKFMIEQSEQLFVTGTPGERIRSCQPIWRSYAKRIKQVFGDSASYDWSPHYGRAALVFVDGSHAYEYVCIDSATAFHLIKPGGRIIWHDYGVWPGVTKALNDLEDKNKFGLKHIRGTSLVIWRA